MTNKTFWILFFLTVIFRGAHNLTINDFEIRDLEDTTSYLTTEAQLWQITNHIGAATTTQCQGNWMLGGYGVTGAGTVFSRDYQSLPAHNLIHFSMTFWIIDLVESTSLFEIYFDSQLVGQWDSNNYDFTTLGTTNICGGSQADYSSIVITGEVAHSVQSLTFKVSSLFTAGTNSFSFGFRNLNLLFYGSGSASTSVCQFVDTSDSEASCFCPSGQYDKAGNPSCKSCNAACSTCLGPNNKQCASCTSGYSFDGEKCVQCTSSCGQCSSSGTCTQCTSDKFLYWNSTCLASCDSPLVQNIQGIYKYCEMPCDDSNEYLYQNNTCGSVCPSPLVSSQNGMVKLCNFPCNSGSFYSTWNSTCITSCESPLIQRTQGTESYCELPCDSGEFLYENDSCGLDCLSPLVSSQDGVVKLCNFPCNSGSFYYTWNSTCITSCDPPLVQSIQGNERYCELPCDTSEFLYEDDSCGLDCPSPLVSSQEGDVKLCHLPCNSGSFYYSWNSTCIASCESPLIQNIQGDYQSCELPCDSGEFLYEDDSCGLDCPSPLVSSQEGDVKLCNFPCDSSSFYYSWNSTCMTSCDSPLVQNIQGNYQSCELPCDSSEFLYEEDNTCHSTCPTPMESSQEGDVKLCNFPCDSGSFYYSWNSTCMTSCDSPLVQNIQGTERYCELPCDTSEYLYQNNNTCESVCPSPLESSQEGDVKLCNFPCDSSSFYYSLNSSCIASCDSPLIQNIQGTEKYCDLPCDSNEYLYEDDSCGLDCPSPLVSSQEGDVKLCNFPCDNGSFYASWNSSCISSCDSPLVQSIQGNYQSCELPCDNNEYLYEEDNTCHSDCPTPMESSQENDIKLCNSPCSSGLFYYENNTCHNNCPSPYISVNTSYVSSCNKPCSNSQYYNQDHDACLTSCDSPNLIQDEQGVLICVEVVMATNTSDFVESPLSQAIGSVASSLSSVANIIRPSSTNSVFMTALAKLVKYVKYMNVSLPDQVRQAFESSNSSSFSFSTTLSYSMPQSLEGSLEQHPLPATFERTELNSSYLMNQWSSFSTLSLVVCLGVTFYALDIYAQKSRKSPRLTYFSKRMRILTEWNLLLYFIFNIYDDLTLFFILEFKTLQLDSFGSYLSFFACISVTLFALFLLGMTLYIPHQRRKTSEEVPFYLKWENLQVLYAGYETKSFLQRNFLFISTFRIVITYILVGCFYSYPMLQTPIFTTTSLLIVFILIKLRPIKDWMNWVFAVGFEGLTLVINICLLILAIADCFTEGMTSFKKSVSQVILVSNMLVNIVSTLYIPGCLIGCAYYCYNVCKKSRKSGQSKKIVWLNMLICIYSNPGMDFDDLSNDIDRKSEKIQKKKFTAKITPLVITPIFEEKSFIQMSPLSQSIDKLVDNRVSIPGSPVMSFDSSRRLMMSAPGTPKIVGDPQVEICINNSSYVPQKVDENFNSSKLEVHSAGYNKFEDSFLSPSTMTKAESIRDHDSVETKGTSIEVEDDNESWSERRRRIKPRAQTQKMITNGLKGFSTSAYSRQSVFGKASSTRDELPNGNQKIFEFEGPKKRVSHPSSRLWRSSLKRASFLSSNANIPTISGTKIFFDLEAAGAAEFQNNLEDSGTFECLKEDNIEKPKDLKEQPLILVNNLLTYSSLRKGSDSLSNYSNDAESI